MAKTKAEEADIYVVESLQKSRVSRKKATLGELEYLVKWKGYKEADNTWEPAASVQHLKVKVAALAKLQNGKNGTRNSKSETKRGRSTGPVAKPSPAKRTRKPAAAKKAAPAKPASKPKSTKKAESSGDVRYLEFTKRKVVTVKTRVLAELKADEVEVKTYCSAVSAGTELMYYLGKFEGADNEKSDVDTDITINSLTGDQRYPMAYGYCLVGTVVRMGDGGDDEKEKEEEGEGDKNVGKVEVGSRVFVFHPHTDRCVVKKTDVKIIPEGIKFEDAVFAPSVETAVSLVQDAAPRLDERVAVFGQGVIGLLVTALFARGNFVKLTAIDLAAKRLALAKTLSESVNESSTIQVSSTPEGEYDVCMEITGAPKALQTAMDHVKKGGKVLVGSWYGTSPLSLRLGTVLHRSQAKLVFSQVSTVAADLSLRWSKQRRWETVWDMIRELKPSTHLISHRVPMTDSGASALYKGLSESPNKYFQAIFDYNLS